jgi:hypothetical protein
VTVASRGVLSALAGLLLVGCGPVATPSPAESACVEADLRVTATPWSGAAGSRWTEVVVEHVGEGACILPPAPVVGLVDAEGRLLLESTPAADGGAVLLEPGHSSGFQVRYSNACERAVAAPIALYLALDTSPVEVEDAVIASADDLPPCNAPDQPPSIEAGSWEMG